MYNEIKSNDEIVKIADRLRKQGKVIVTTNGSFDFVHYGHIDLLLRAREMGDTLIVLVNSDCSVRGNKGPERPMFPQEIRARVISALKPVSYVTIFDEDKPLNLLSKIKPHIHVKGGSADPDRIREEVELVESWGGKHVQLPLIPGYSTTNIIERIRGTKVSY